MSHLTNYPRHFPTEAEVKAWEAYRSAVLLLNHPSFKTLPEATQAWIKSTASDKPADPRKIKR
jgi:hypothetical protein